MHLKRSAASGVILWAGILALAMGCGRSSTQVQEGIRGQILHKGNGQEPEDLDPHIVNGVPEHNIMAALLEGLVSENPQTLDPMPGMAERWEISEEGKVYTFTLRDGADWSNGDPVTAGDFVFSFRRILSPSLGSSYAYMLYVMDNAEAFHKGELDDFDRVGVKALDDKTLEIRLTHPTPYFLSLLNHWTWLPVHPPTILKHGTIDERGTRWTQPKHFVGNGPFTLASWKSGWPIIVEKNQGYWDAENVRLNGIHFYSMGNATTEERAFRAGQLHMTYQTPLSKIPVYRTEQPERLRIDPYLATYFYCVNVTRPPLDDVRVRRALALALDRKPLVNNVLRGGQVPAYHFTPPNTAGYTARASFEENLAEARKLLSEAGYPFGEGFPAIKLLYNTSENHRIIAEAVQQMWKKHLNIKISLENQEWKVYINTRRQGDFDICRFGWTGDYLDPNTFLDMWVTGGGNNAAQWSNREYDEWIQKAAQTSVPEKRFAAFQRAEEILIDELPVIPIYFYTTIYLVHPSVKNWHPTILDHHPYKYVYLAESP